MHWRATLSRATVAQALTATTPFDTALTAQRIGNDDVVIRANRNISLSVHLLRLIWNVVRRSDD